jgi:hypothetical protein
MGVAQRRRPYQPPALPLPQPLLPSLPPLLARLWLLALLTCAALRAEPARATTYNSPNVDGVAQVDAADWDADELFYEDPVGDSAWGPFNDLQGLRVTWDPGGIYLAVSGALWDVPAGQSGQNSVNLYIDVDYGKRTGIADLSLINQNALGAISRNLWRPLTVGSGFGCDFGFTNWAGRYDLGFLDLADPNSPVNRVNAITQAKDLAGNTGYELFIPWNVLYPNAAAQVPPGTRIAVVVAQVGGGDSLSPESMPDQSTDRVIDAPLVFTVDADGDGVPDLGWPPNGRIRGTLTLSDPLDTTTQINVVALRDGTVEVARVKTPPGGGPYLLSRLAAGTYTVKIDSRFYLAPLHAGVAVAEGAEVAGIDFLALKVNGGVDVAFRFADGPQATQRTFTLDVVLLPADVTQNEVIAEATVPPSAPLVVSLRPVSDGSYRLLAGPFSDDPRIGLLTGYKPIQQDVVVANDSVTDLGTLDLRIVRATRLAFYPLGTSTSSGPTQPISAAFTTVSIPSVHFYAYLPLQVGFVDDDGFEAILDDAVKGSVTLTATTMDPSIAPEGAVTYWTLPDTAASAQPLLDPARWNPATGDPPTARATLLFTDDRQEVVRLRATHPTAAAAILETGVLPVQPSSIALTAEGTRMVAGGSLRLQGQLKDVSNNNVRLPDLDIGFRIDPAGAQVAPSTATTQSDGSFGSEGNVAFTSTVADTFTLRAFAVPSDSIFSEPLVFIVAPDTPRRLSLGGRVAALGRMQFTLRAEDAFGNASPVAGAQVTIAAGPAAIIQSFPATVALAADGTASFEVATRPQAFGLVEVTATLASLPQPSAELRLEISPGLAAASELAPESDDAHNAVAQVDLTTVFAYSERDTMVVKVPFFSNYSGIHMVLLLEYQGDVAGAVTDYFGFPVSYAHPLLPDYVFTYKYQADNYADFRRPPPGGDPNGWEWYDVGTRTWVTTFADGVDARKASWVRKTDRDVTFRVPVSLFGSAFVVGQDSVRLQVYVTQEETCKRPALDSSPDDATADMVPLLPGVDWCQQLPASVTLHNWGGTVLVETISSLALDDVGFTPPQVTQGETALLTARPVFRAQPPPSPSFQVFADLSALGGEQVVPLRDDGLEGDAAAGDGLYSLRWSVSRSTFAGEPEAVISALELSSGARARARAKLTITGQPELVPILAVQDSLRDDHGPDQQGRQYLYYQYPTSGVFFDGVFDLKKLEIFDLDQDLLFRVTLRDLTDPSEPGAADWKAVYPRDANCPAGSRVDLNLQNVIVLVDSKDGGSTKLPQNRWADVAPQDAWEYALVADGWWKGLVSSNGSSSSGSWVVDRNDETLFFCASSDANTIDIFVRKDKLGLSASADSATVNAAVRRWDTIVTLSGHDGDSNDDNWGAVRWVNEGIAEWQFGGGKNGDSGRERDPNIVDVLAHAGTGKHPGRAQQEQLDFLTADAQRRFQDGQVAVRLEAQQLIDTAPPKVTFLRSVGRALTSWPILRDGPIAVLATVEDETGVDWANLLWRGLGESRGNERTVPLGHLRSDLEKGVIWVADIRWDDIVGQGVTNLVQRTLPDGSTQSVRYLVVSFDAQDLVGNRTDPAARQEFLLELPVQPVDSLTYPIDRALLQGVDTYSLDLPEGSRLRVDAAILRGVLPAGNGGRLELTYEAAAHGTLDLTPRGDNNETVLTAGNRFLGTARRLTLRAVAGDSTMTEISVLPQVAELSLHFPRYDAGGDPPADLQLFHWTERAGRWVLAGGHGERGGSTVTARVRELGLYGTFTKSSQVDADAIVTGLQLSPNPFSPNGDGLHDLLSVSYVLPQETREAIVEVYDLRGARVRTLLLFQGEATTNRTLGLQWDGKDELGHEVPTGIYIVRVQVRGSQIDRWERQSKAVAVVR